MTSSIGPNGAGRIGVGFNVMALDPHDAARVAQESVVGTGVFVYKVYNVCQMPSFSG